MDYDNCCIAGGTCPDPDVIACVERFGPGDCTTENWPEECARAALQHCGLACTSGGDCCSEHLARGCASPDVTACVCALDARPECCTDAWGPDCVAEAMRCGMSCPGRNLDCCTSHDSPTCADKEVSTCVCIAAESCCGETWTDECVGWARTCLACPSANPCDAPSNLPGCEDPDVMFDVCVVEGLIACCFEAWTAPCVEAANAA